jgi:hypothetical protein
MSTPHPPRSAVFDARACRGVWGVVFRGFTIYSFQRNNVDPADLGVKNVNVYQ